MRRTTSGKRGCDDGYRFYFQIDGETYLLLPIIPHPK